MSEDKRQLLAETLTSLSNEDKAWVINFLVQGIFPAQKKVMAHKKRSDEFTDEQWEDYFEHLPVSSLPEETMSPKEIIEASSGRTIKQIEKWL